MTGLRPFEVDTDELRAQGSAMVRTGDDVTASARRGILLAAGNYGQSDADAAAQRFAARFTYLVRGMGEDIADVGVEMRGAADGYEEADALISDGFRPMPH